MKTEHYMEKLTMKYKYAEIDNGMIDDYRLNQPLPFIHGRMKDLKTWYIKSDTLGDLLSSINPKINLEGLSIIKYSRGYVLGIYGGN